ncbi:hypothetical protein Taro_027603 [Colocasia esculenta]|uniref:Uncharacterized protein n=1 Tax=Colocasia esculenta TaxID=4460 RepID=A0A843VKL3_COLES|nr:hypothetical protein [Colocasia esculenta]
MDTPVGSVIFDRFARVMGRIKVQKGSVFLACARFGKVTYYKVSLDRDPYHDFLEAQLVLHLKRMAPSMGPNYSVGPGPFKTYFEKREEQAWEIISHFASLLSSAYYLPL